VSAVGHEVDVTIADLVADLRAATPSAAAELLVPDGATLRLMLRRRREQVELAAARALRTHAQRLDQLQQRLQAQRPAARLERGRQRLSELRHRLSTRARTSLDPRRERSARLLLRLQAVHPRQRIEHGRGRLQLALQRERTALQRALERRTLRLQALARALAAVSPIATLARGYAILSDEQGTVLRAAHQAQPGQALHARLSDGELSLRVESAPPRAR
jgi:exodeoxyribonuclease VII large subunit